MAKLATPVTAAAVKDASEEYLEIAATITHVAANTANNFQLSATNTPIAVATPLPPLKPKKTGNKCPIKAAIATIASTPLLTPTC